MRSGLRSAGFDTKSIDLRAAIFARRRRVGVSWRLTNRPQHICRKQVPGNVAAQDATPVVKDDEEAMEHAEGQRRHGEEVYRGNRLTVILQERRPSLCGPGFLGAFLIQRSTVRSEMSGPSIFSSPWNRGAPHVRFSAPFGRLCFPFSPIAPLGSHCAKEKGRRRYSAFGA